MFQYNLLKKSIALIFLVCTFYANGQTGILFQAIAQDNNMNPAKNRKIYVQSNIIATAPKGPIALIEEHTTNTNDNGVFSIMVGNGKRVGGIESGLSAIDWSNGPFYLNLKIAITPVSASLAWDYTKEWVDLGTTIFGTVPFALYSANTAKINDKLNILDTFKMLEPYAKLITVQGLSSTIDAKLVAKDTSTMLSAYSRKTYVDAALSTKFNLIDTIQYTKQKYTDAALSTKFNLIDTIQYTKQKYTDAALSTKFNLIDTIQYTKQKYTDSAINTKLNLNGNAISATIAGNITATTNTSITSLSNLNTIGTITTGIWSATTIDIAHGGTGLKTAGLIGQALTTSAAGTLTWTNISELTGIHYIGESFGGGIVFYVYDNGKHGLIVSTEDQSTGCNWYNGSYITTNAIRDGINAGILNTERIILSQGAGNYAAQIAANYKGGGFGDWYLPSAYELELLLKQRALFFTGSNVINYYYSSNENPNNNKQVMCYRFSPTLYNSYFDKLNREFRVRAIRAF